MAELKNLTVEALRDLARKALGRGHSKLRTKSELVAALQAASRSVGEKVKVATGRAAKAATRAVKTATAKTSKGAKVAKAAAAKPATKPAAKPATPAARKEPAEKARRPKPAPAVEVQPTDPDPEGYFVARIAGEDAVRDAPHPMTESALDAQRAGPPEAARRPAPRRAAEYEEHLGELPWTYGDDSFVALPRDPRTLYLYWDHASDTLSEAFVGLGEGTHAQLWVFGRRPDGGWDRVRVLDFALESRSYFVHDLEPGRAYRVEIHLIDRAGKDRLLHQTSNEMTLPPFGPSPTIDDRFMRIPWGTPLQRLLQHFRKGEPFPEEIRALLAHLSDWARFSGPTWGAGAGTSGAGPGGPSGESSWTSSPWGPSGGGRSGEGR